jgi:hypothetical protein
VLTITGLRGRLEAGLARVGIRGRILPIVGVGAGVIAAYAAVALLHRSGAAPAAAPVGAPGSNSDWASGLSGGLGPSDGTAAPIVFGPGQVVPNTGTTVNPPGVTPSGVTYLGGPTPRAAGQSTGPVAPTTFGAPIASSLATTPSAATPAGGYAVATFGKPAATPSLAAAYIAAAKAPAPAPVVTFSKPAATPSRAAALIAAATAPAPASKPKLVGTA